MKPEGRILTGPAWFTGPSLSKTWSEIELHDWPGPGWMLGKGHFSSMKGVVLTGEKGRGKMLGQ